jgi:hypothetical protein
MLLSDFYPYILPSVIGAPEPTVDHHILQAAIAFCRRTLCYTRTLDAIVANGTDTKFTLVPPANTEVIKIMGVAVDGRTWTVVDTQRGIELVRNDSYQDFAFTEDRSTIDVYPLQAVDIEILVDAALVPTFTATTIDSYAVSRYMQDIAKGALASLQMMPKTDWSDVGHAKVNADMFNSRCETVAMVISRGQANAKLRGFKTFV